MDFVHKYDDGSGIETLHEALDFSKLYDARREHALEAFRNM